MQDAMKITGQITDLRVTEDGDRIIPRMQDTAAGEVVLDIPPGQIPRLIALGARALAESKRVHDSGTGPRARVDVTWWNLQQDESDSFLLSRNFGAGGSLSFDLSLYVAAALLAVLNVHLFDPTDSSLERPGFVE
jgi:hypothetical protein